MRLSVHMDRTGSAAAVSDDGPDAGENIQNGREKSVMPAVSVILPLYNGERFIRQTIRRIRSQTFPDWELLVINDGSSDRSGRIALQEAAADSRIQVFEKPNGGVSSARNLGISKASGRYLAFADQDDCVGKNWLRSLFSGMAGDMDLVVGGKILEVTDASGRMIKSRRYTYPDTVLETEKERYQFMFNEMHDASSLHVWNCLYKKELIDRYHLCFDETLKTGMEDILFNICYGNYCRKIHKIPQTVYRYRQRIGISTSSKEQPDLAEAYSRRMQQISHLPGFSTQHDGFSDAYRMYGMYALRELCNLYFRYGKADSIQTLEELRNAYVKQVPHRDLHKHFKKRILLKDLPYIVADKALRQKRYFLISVLKRGADYCGKRKSRT